MMFSGSRGISTGIFGGTKYTINIGDAKAEMRFGWLEVYATLDGKAMNINGLDGGSATWFSYDEEEWGHSKSGDKVKDMWKGCSQACPVSFFVSFLGFLLASGNWVMGAKRNKNSGKLALGHLVSAALCTLCGVTTLLAFSLGCYRKVTAEGAGVSTEVFERSIGGGFVAAIIATFLSAIMTVLVFLSRCQAATRQAAGIKTEEKQDGEEHI